MKQMWLALVFCFLALGPARASVMSMQGKGVITVVPDQFRIWVEIDSSSDASSSTWKLHRSAIEDLYRSVQSEGVEREQFSVLDLKLRARNNQYTAKSTVSIVVSVGLRNGELLDVIQRGTSVRVMQFDYIHSNARALSDKARALAVEDAMRQMNELAIRSGGHIGHVISIGKNEVGGFRSDSDGPRTRGTLERRSVPLSPGLLRIAEEIRIEVEFFKGE